MKIIKSIFQKINTWRKENKKEFYILLAILLLGAVLRLYRIDGYMTFLGDEGRDAIVVRRLLVNLDPILIGPGTSIGNMYLGPLYYYLITPSLLLANFSPVGPSIFVALLGIVTIGMVYFIGREWFGKTAGIIASLLYALSPTVIIYSRSSWNPNVMPFFALLCIYAIWKVWQKAGQKESAKTNRWLIVLGISFAFVLNSHYLGLALVPVLGLFWLLALLKLKKNDQNIRPFIIHSLLGGAIFLFLMSPLVIFDARHGWNNFASVKEFFTKREQTVSIKPWKAIPNSWPIYQEYITRLIGGRDKLVGWVAAFGVFDLFALYFVFRRKNLSESEKSGYFVLAIWLISATIGLGLYKQHIYDHYYGFFFVAPFLLTGAVLGKLIESRKKLLILLGLVFTVGLIVPSIINSPLRNSPNMQMKRAQEVSKRVIEISEGQNFNFTLIAQSNYDTGYRYFLDVYDAKVKDVDPMNTSGTITSQLIVVCEMEKEKCDPTHNAKAEVVNFGWTKIDTEEQYFGVTIYKLGHAR